METINILTYKTYEKNHLSFEFLIDGKPLAEYVGFEDTMIPYWIVQKGIPVYEWTSERIVAVCTCGEYGCDCILCKIDIAENFVTFTDFRREGFSNLPQVEFKFTLENFKSIESKLKVAADSERSKF